MNEQICFLPSPRQSLSHWLGSKSMSPCQSESSREQAQAAGVFVRKVNLRKSPSVCVRRGWQFNFVIVGRMVTYIVFHVQILFVNNSILDTNILFQTMESHVLTQMKLRLPPEIYDILVLTALDTMWEANERLRIDGVQETRERGNSVRQRSR